MTQPFDRGFRASAPGTPDRSLGEFWEPNMFLIPQAHNLSSFERNRFFLSREGRFEDVSYFSGADSDGDGRSVVAADFNGDGKLDLLVRQAGGGSLQLFRNQFPDTAGSLTVSLLGGDSNKLALGARITLESGGKSQIRDVFPHNTHRSEAPLRQHFGLGDGKRIDRVTVRWPSGAMTVIKGITANQHILVREASGDFVTFPDDS